MSASTRSSLPARIWSFVLDHAHEAAVVVSLLTIFVLIGTVTTWAITSYKATADGFARDTIQLTTMQGGTLEIDYPQKLLLASAPAELRVSLSAPMALERPVVVELAFSDWIWTSRSDTNANRILTEVMFPPVPSRSQAKSLLIENAGNWLGSDWATALILVKTDADQEDLVIEVEGTKQATRRQVAAAALNEKGPLLLGGAAIMTILAALLQQVAKVREEQKERQKDRQKQAEELCLKLRQCLREANCREARCRWQEPATVRLLGELPGQDREWLENLLRLADGALISNGQPDHEMVTFIQEMKQSAWLSEVVGALVCAELKAKKDADAVTTQPGQAERTDVNVYRDQARDLPLEKLTDTGLRDKVIRLWRRLKLTTIQHWSPTIYHSPDSAPPRSVILARAEWEQTTLYYKEVNGAFWDGHEHFGFLLQTRGNQLIYGDEGSGRTALAMGLYARQKDAKAFTIYLAGQPPLNAIQATLARHVLDYIGEKPTLLVELGEANRYSLASLLVSVLSSAYVQAEIEAVLFQGGWFTQLDSKEREETWRVVGNTQLELLKQAVTAAASGQPLAETAWIAALVRCLTSLGFANGVRLILDAPAGTGQWVNEVIGPRLSTWHNLGLVTLLFVPADLDRRGLASLAGNVGGIELTWSAEQLRKMADHRLLKTTGKQAIELLTEAGYNKLVTAAAGNPRRLLRLWSVAQSERGPDTEQVTAAEVDAALRKIAT